METSPINKNTLQLFTGRDKELLLLDKLLKIYNVAIIEGDYGVGKTSLGNYYRFSSGFMTPLEEISTDTRWDTKEFLHEVIKNILEYCIHEKFLTNATHIKDLMARYNNILSADFDLGIMGNNLKYKQNIDQELVQTQTGLIYDLKKLGEIAQKNDSKLIIQLNNLDTSMTEPKSIVAFFSKNRNIFQIPNIQWILTGSSGLSDLFKKELPKFSSIIGKPLVLSNMENQEVSSLVSKRYPMEESLLLKLIQDKQSLRDILNIISIFKKETLSNKKKIKSYFDFFEFVPQEIEILKELTEPMSAKDIAKKINKSYKTVNNRLKDLMIKQAVTKNKNIYTIAFEAYCFLY